MMDGSAYAAGSSRVSLPTQQNLEAMASFHMRGLWFSELSGKLYQSKEGFQKAPPEIQEKFVSGFVAAYKEAFKKNSKPAF